MVNILEWLYPMNYRPTEQPYASNFYMELHYDSECLASKNSTSCFTVESYANGTPLRFDTCINANKKAGSTSIIC